MVLYIAQGTRIQGGRNLFTLTPKVSRLARGHHKSLDDSRRMLPIFILAARQWMGSVFRICNSPVLTSTWSRRDRITAVARYPCIMIISHWDMLNPVCHKLGASSTIFPSLFPSHPHSPNSLLLPHSRPEFNK